jgi:4-phospho-D-threonate 3-dehydrogenase / 4-phospho-D-erythronate 3-dehydrogenase
MFKPILGITMGDPASIGPEISVKALADPAIYETCKPLIVGDACVMEAAARIVGRPDIRIHAIHNVKDAAFTFGTIDVLDMGLVDMDKLVVGKVSEMAGDAAFRYVKRVIELAISGEVDATVTNALNKEAINLAGHHYSGHTEIYADATGIKKYTMMLAYQNLRVVHVSTHVSLKRAIELVKKERILEVIRIAAQALKNMGIENPKIGVAGLNPHCGEGGLFGTEDVNEILPAVKAAQEEGILAEGPIPADTVFSKARGGWYDVVVVMYHDQGHIPLKVLGFVYDQEHQKWEAVEGVNITLGLPIIRTSVDHGTAFDQAGKGVANELSLKNAIVYAIRFAVSK